MKGNTEPSGLPSQQQPKRYPCRRFHLIPTWAWSSAWGQVESRGDKLTRIDYAVEKITVLGEGMD
jgi:hypothetical protein